MCGRYTLTAAADELAAELGVDVPPGYEPRYNIAPQQPILVLGRDAEGRRRTTLLRWGLVPWWTAAEKTRTGPINARAETIAVRPTFRDAFRSRRCLVIADGFYEWKREGRTRVPFHFRFRDGGVMTFAGLWESWRGTDESDTLYTCAIVTTPADAIVGPLHDRMPAILTGGARERWIDPDADPASLSGLLAPLGDPRLEACEVSRLVNSVANDSPDCIKPA